MFGLTCSGLRGYDPPTKEKWEETTQELSTLREEKSTLEKQLADRKDQLAVIFKKLATADEEKNQLHERVEHLTEKYQEAKQSLDADRETADQLAQTCQSISEELDLTRKELNTLREENGVLLEKLGQHRTKEQLRDQEESDRRKKKASELGKRWIGMWRRQKGEEKQKELALEEEMRRKEAEERARTEALDLELRVQELQSAVAEQAQALAEQASIRRQSVAEQVQMSLADFFSVRVWIDKGEDVASKSNKLSLTVDISGQTQGTPIVDGPSPTWDEHMWFMTTAMKAPATITVYEHQSTGKAGEEQKVELGSAVYDLPKLWQGKSDPLTDARYQGKLILVSRPSGAAREHQAGTVSVQFTLQNVPQATFTWQKGYADTSAVLEVLHYSNCGLELRDLSRRTALQNAVVQNQADPVRVLLEAKASPLTKDSRTGKNSFHLAADAGSTNCMRQLVQVPGIDLEAVDDQGRTALHASAERGDDEMVSMLLEKKVHVDTQTAAGDAALHLAARKGASGCVQALVKAGADVKSSNKKKESPLILSAMSMNTEATRVLLEHKADVAQRDANNLSALVHTSIRGHSADAAALLEANALPDDTDSEGNTCLMIAARQGHTEVCKVLVDAGADRARKDVKGRTAQKIADKSGHKKLYKEKWMDPKWKPKNK